MSLLKRLSPEHWLLIAGFLTSVGTILGSVDSWAQLARPGVVAGFLGLLAIQIRTIFATPPAPPDSSNTVNVRRPLAIFAVMVLGGTVLGCGGNIPAKFPAASPSQVQSVRALTRQAIATTDLVLTYADNGGKVIDVAPVEAKVKDAYDCGLVRLFGVSAPASTAVLRVCGDAPLHDQAPFTRAVTTLRGVTTCPGLSSATAAVVGLLDPWIADIASSGNQAAQFIALSLQTTLKILRSMSTGETPCSA